MAVAVAATSLASLLEKLKVEQPYLPPRNWESLHSVSGRFPHPPTRSSASASPSSSSSVSESSLVKLALNALQGVESSLISIEKLSSVLCSDPADRTTLKIPSLWHRLSSTDALGQILRNIGCFGSSVFLLHKFVVHFHKLLIVFTKKKKKKAELAKEFRLMLSWKKVKGSMKVKETLLTWIEA